MKIKDSHQDSQATDLTSANGRVSLSMTESKKLIVETEEGEKLEVAAISFSEARRIAFQRGFTPVKIKRETDDEVD